MSNLFSQEMQQQLKDLKSQLGKSSTEKTDKADKKPTEPVVLPTAKQVSKKVKQLDSEHLDDDKMLFMQAMAGVEPLADKNEITISNGASKEVDSATLSKRISAQGGDDETVSGLSDMQALLNPVSGDAYLSYKVATLQNKVFNQLKQGKLRWYDAVDIHGCSIEEAREAMLKLINQAKQNNETVVKIVHGKGTDAVLKTCVNGWLRQLSEVLAFCSAPNKDGGAGAVLVLLKKQKTA